MVGPNGSDGQVRTPTPRISGLDLKVVHVGVDILRALGPTRDLDKGKGESRGQDICPTYKNRHRSNGSDISSSHTALPSNTVRTVTVTVSDLRPDSSQP